MLSSRVLDYIRRAAEHLAGLHAGAPVVGLDIRQELNRPAPLALGRRYLPLDRWAVDEFVARSAGGAAPGGAVLRHFRSRSDPRTRNTPRRSLSPPNDRSTPPLLDNACALSFPTNPSLRTDQPAAPHHFPRPRSPCPASNE